jgi:hypothetical protein
VPAFLEENRYTLFPNPVKIIYPYEISVLESFKYPNEKK